MTAPVFLQPAHMVHVGDLRHHVNNTGPLTSDDNLENLYPALVECFGIILLGFIAGKFRLISETEAKGLGTFVGNFSLPALIFSSLCQLNLTSVNWLFIGSVCISKSIVFFSVLMIGVISKGRSIASYAMYAIFCTTSNDFAVGFPVLKAIFGESHPSYPMYVYLVAPVSLVLLNPIAFAIIEVSQSSGSGTSRIKIFTKVSKNILTNPVIFMTVAGMVSNLVLQGTMPQIIEEFMGALGSSFAASALFLLGLRMNKQTNVAHKSQSVVLPFVLGIVKLLLLPLITREIVTQIGAGRTTEDTVNLANLGFMYGSFPAAASTFIFASKYNIDANMIATAIPATTFAAVPIIYVSAKLLKINNLDPVEYEDQINIFLFNISIIGLIAAAWVIFVLLITKKAYQLPHQITLVLTITQGIACIGTILGTVVDCSTGWKLYVQFFIVGLGVYGSRVSAAVLAMTLVLHNRIGSFIVKYRKRLLSTALLLPLLIVLLVLSIMAVEGSVQRGDMDHSVQFGNAQAISGLVIIVLSVLVTITCLIIFQRDIFVKMQQKAPSSETQRLMPSDPKQEEDEVFQDAVPSETDVEKNLVAETARRRMLEKGENKGSVNGGVKARRYTCDATHRQYCTSLIRRYEVPPGEDALAPDNVIRCSSNLILINDREESMDKARLSLLLILLCISMFVGGALCIWSLLMESMSGIYLELVYIDGFLNLGQPIFTLGIFCINTKGIVMNLRRLVRWLVYGRKQILLPPWEDLDDKVRNVSTRFIKYHLDICMEELLHDIHEGLRRHTAAFHGRELVDWLVEFGLAPTRQEAECLGRQLLRGRVIRHVDDHLDFYDAKFLYTFLPRPANESRS